MWFGAAKVGILGEITKKKVDRSELNNIYIFQNIDVYLS